MTIPKPSDVDLVIYHGSCRDGHTAAYAAWKLLGNKPTFYAAKFGDPPPDVRGKNVAIVDFSYNREITERLAAEANSLVVLDHHITAKDALSDLPYARFDMNHSGAYLAWEFFHPGTPVPYAIQMIEDTDLWRFKLPETKAFCNYIHTLPFEFEIFDRYVEDPKAILGAVLKGVNFKELVDRTVDKLTEHAAVRDFHGFKTGVVNSPVHQSEIGNALSSIEGIQVGMIWYYDHDARTHRVSLRSNSDAVNVSALAKKYGGGGHIRASGFEWKGPIEGLFEDPR